MTNNRRIAKNTLFLYFRMFLVMGVSLVTASVTMRVLGFVDYGLHVTLGGIVAMFSFLNGALSGAASRYITVELGRGNKERLNTIFNASLVIFIALGLIITLLSETVGLWFFYNKMTIPPERITAAFWVLQISIMTCPLQLTQIPYSAMIIAHEDMAIYAYVSIVDAALKLFFVYLLTISPFDKLVTLTVLWFVCSLATVVFYRVYCIRKYKETKLCLCRDVALYFELFKYAGSDLIGNVSRLAQGQGINLLLNVFFGPTVNAARGVAYSVQGMVSQFSNNFLMAVRPQIIKSYAAGDYEGAWKLVVRSSCFSFYLMLVLIIPVCIEADYLLKLWLGSYPAHTLSFLHIIMAICLLDMFYNPRFAIFHASGKILRPNLVMGLILCGAFPLAYIFARRGLAPEWSVASCLITFFCADIAAIVVVKRYIDYSIPKYLLSVHFRCFIVAMLGAVVPFLICNRIMSQSIIRCFVSGVISLLSVGLVAFSIGMDSDMRKKTIETILKKVRRT